MAEKFEKGIFGRKVFFLYPTYSFQSDIMERLRTMEYEVYVINDYKNAKNTLKKNQGSILFINVDNFFSAVAWINFINSFAENEDLKDCSIGIITDKADRETIRLYEGCSGISSGIFRLSANSDENLQLIVKQLDKDNAKGRRQYVRANCLDDPSAEVFWITNNIMYKLKIIDISAVGIAVKIPLRQAGALKPGQLLKNISLMLKAKPMPINATVYAIKHGEEFNTGVFLIEKDTGKTALSTIRSYVAEKLQKRVEDQIFGMNPDREDYSRSK